MDRAQVGHQAPVEAAQQPDGRRRGARAGPAAGRGRTRRTRRRAGPCRRRRRRGRTGSGAASASRDTQARAAPKPGSVPPGEEQLEAPAQPVALLGVDQPHRPQAPGRPPPRGGRSCRRCRGRPRRRRRAPAGRGPRRTLSTCWSMVNRVPGPNRLEPVPGRSMTWHVTWSTRCGSSVRHVAPLTGQPCTKSTSGPDPTRRYATSPSPTSRKPVGVAAEQVGGVGGRERRHGAIGPGSPTTDRNELTR